MSYFMTIAGEVPRQAFPSLKFMPISEGQKYIADLDLELSLADGTPLWFVHDGETGTSHSFVSNAQSHFNEHGSPEGTLLLRLMQDCVKAGCTFRIWWAAVDPGCYRNVPEFTSIDELFAGIARMLGEGCDISLRWNGHGQPGASPKGSPETCLGSSRVTKGPPSVS
jgi:hypothetical protein